MVVEVSLDLNRARRAVLARQTHGEQHCQEANWQPDRPEQTTAAPQRIEYRSRQSQGYRPFGAVTLTAKDNDGAHLANRDSKQAALVFLPTPLLLSFPGFRASGINPSGVLVAALVVTRIAGGWRTLKALLVRIVRVEHERSLMEDVIRDRCGGEYSQDRLCSPLRESYWSQADKSVNDS